MSSLPTIHSRAKRSAMMGYRMDWALIDKTLRWLARLSIIVFGILWGPTIFLLFWFGIVAPIALFFEQDYHPWSESMADLSATRSKTKVVADSRELEDVFGDCAAFYTRLATRSAFFLLGGVYCKVRTKSKCACSSDSYWVKIHVTRGAYRGRDVWVCGDAIGPTVAWP